MTTAPRDKHHRALDSILARIPRHRVQDTTKRRSAEGPFMSAAEASSAAKSKPNAYPHKWVPVKVDGEWFIQLYAQHETPDHAFDKIVAGIPRHRARDAEERTFTSAQLKASEETVEKAREALSASPSGIQRAARRKDLETAERWLKKVHAAKVVDIALRGIPRHRGRATGDRLRRRLGLTRDQKFKVEAEFTTGKKFSQTFESEPEARAKFEELKKDIQTTKVSIGHTNDAALDRALAAIPDRRRRSARVRDDASDILQDYITKKITREKAAQQLFDMGIRREKGEELLKEADKRRIEVGDASSEKDIVACYKRHVAGGSSRSEAVSETATEMSVPERDVSELLRSTGDTARARERSRTALDRALRAIPDCRRGRAHRVVDARWNVTGKSGGGAVVTANSESEAFKKYKSNHSDEPVEAHELTAAELRKRPDWAHE